MKDAFWRFYIRRLEVVLHGTSVAACAGPKSIFSPLSRVLLIRAMVILLRTDQNVSRTATTGIAKNPGSFVGFSHHVSFDASIQVKSNSTCENPAISDETYRVTFR
jgi:hypothetical protein